MKDYSTTWEPLLNAYDAKSVQIVCTAGREVSVREKKVWFSSTGYFQCLNFKNNDDLFWGLAEVQRVGS